MASGVVRETGGERSVGEPDMYRFVSCCLFHDCLTGCLAVLTVVSVCDRVEIYTLMSSTHP